MSLPIIHSIGAIKSSALEGVERSTKLPPLPPTETLDPANSFSKALSDARSLDHDAAQQAEKFANNDPSIGIHEVMIASEKANIALRYVTTIKNKALEAYHELMSTQV